MCEWFDRSFIYGKFFGFPVRWETKTITLVTAGHLRLKGLVFGIGSPQKGIPSCTGFIFPYKHGVVVLGALIENPRPKAGFQYLPADAASG